MRTLFESPLLRSLFVLNLIVIGLLFLPQLSPLPRISTANKLEVTTSDIAEFLGGDDHGISEALARPLFHANRRPPQELQAPVEVAPIIPKADFTLELVGVMGAAASRTAFLMDSRSQQTHTVKVGQVVGGWSIIEIEANAVRMSNDVEEKVLSLN